MMPRFCMADTLINLGGASYYNSAKHTTLAQGDSQTQRHCFDLARLIV